MVKVENKKIVEKAEAIIKPALLKAKNEQLRNNFNLRLKKNIKRHQIKNNLTAPKHILGSYQQLVAVSDTRIKIQNNKDVNQDIQRQVQTYQITLDNVNKLFEQLKHNNIPFQRPADYLAQMYKSDTHMTKIRKILVQKEDGLKQKMQNKKWQKRKKRQEKRQPTSDKNKKIKKMKQKQSGKSKIKAPKMMKVKGKRKQKK